MNSARRTVVLAVVALTWSCDRSAPTAPPAASDAVLLESGGALLACMPQPAESASALIGPAGGTVVVGPHVLRIPEGALVEPVTITAVAPSASVVRVDLAPEGLVFARAATLTLGYAHCGLGYSLLSKRIAYTTDALVILEYLSSLDNLLQRRVTGRLEHFSTYAVAW